METTTLNYFIFFIAGAMSLKFLQGLLSIVASYKIFKFTEYYTVLLMAEVEVWRQQALQILRLCYEEAGKTEEMDKVEKKIHEKFLFLQQNILGNLKANLPYKVEYDGILEGYKKLLKEKEDEGRSNNQDA